MSPFQEFGKVLILIGIFMVIIGLFLFLMPKIPFIGRLPGDIIIKKDNFTFYFPVATSILLSIILSILFSIFRR